MRYRYLTYIIMCIIAIIIVACKSAHYCNCG